MIFVFAVLALVTSTNLSFTTWVNNPKAIGAHGEMLFKEYDKNILHFYSFDTDVYRKLWTKPVPSTVTGLSNMVISPDGNLHLISGGRTHEFSKDLQHVSSSHGYLLACLATGRKAFCKEVDGR